MFTELLWRDESRQMVPHQGFVFCYRTRGFEIVFSNREGLSSIAGSRYDHEMRGELYDVIARSGHLTVQIHFDYESMIVLRLCP